METVARNHHHHHHQEIEMRVIKLLVLIQGIALLFLLAPYSVENPDIGQWFYFSDVEMPFRTYLWMLCSEHINWIIMYGIVLSLVPHKYRFAVFLFAWMEVLYMIEFLFIYNEAWFSLPLIGKMGMTHFFVIFKGMILLKLWKEQK